MEYPLLKDNISQVDIVLDDGLTNLTWISENIDEFMTRATDAVASVSEIASTIKQNLKRIYNILHKFNDTPMIERKQKPISPEEFENINKSRIAAKQILIAEGGKEIHKLMKEGADVLRTSRYTAHWRAYVDFVNNIMMEGICSTIEASMVVICDIISPYKSDVLPLFEIHVELSENGINLDPPFEHTATGVGICDMAKSWVSEIYNISTLVVRLDSQSGDLFAEMSENMRLRQLIFKYTRSLSDTKKLCDEYKSSFEKYNFLWVKNIDDAFDEFLLTDSAELVNFEDSDSNFRHIMETIGTVFLLKRNNFLNLNFN